ncbi:MAG: peptidoglycan editing factor PgeF [Gammaproteobacteria bacterium]
MRDGHIRPDWPVPPSVNAAVTVRAAAGASQGEYADFNLASHVDDDPACVTSNRALLVEQLRLPEQPRWLEQVHGPAVIHLDDPHHGSRGDAAVTATVGRVAAVLTADCLPVLLADRGGTRVGVAHCGWRGLASGVIEEAVVAMGVSSGELIAWLGPGISQGAYEVDATVRDAFLALDPAHEGCFMENANQRWQANLYALARRLLAASGVDAISGGGFCTYYDHRRFFSHRRQGACGRMATLIWLS